MVKKIVASAVALGLTVGSTAAAAATAPVGADRAASPVADAENLEGLSGAWLILLFAAIAAGLIILIEGNEDDVDDLPASP